MGSEYDRCKQCGEFGWVGTHRCPPKWEVTHYDEDEDGRAVYAADAGEAAEKYVENNYGDLEYPRELEVLVRPYRDGSKYKRFEVTIELEPNASAVEVATV